MSAWNGRKEGAVSWLMSHADATCYLILPPPYDLPNAISQWAWLVMFDCLIDKLCWLFDSVVRCIEFCGTGGGTKCQASPSSRGELVKSQPSLTYCIWYNLRPAPDTVYDRCWIWMVFWWHTGVNEVHGSCVKVCVVYVMSNVIPAIIFSHFFYYYRHCIWLHLIIFLVGKQAWVASSWVTWSAGVDP